MKALIEIDDTRPGHFRLKLADEGASDRTLLRLLERQYPTLMASQNNSLEIPLEPWRDCDDSRREMVVQSGAEFDTSTYITVTSDPWRGAVLRGVSVFIPSPDVLAWEVERVDVCGRQVPHDHVFDLLPGMTVAVHARRTSSQRGSLTFRVKPAPIEARRPGGIG